MRHFTGDTLVLATHNSGKIAEMTDAFRPYVKNILTAKDLKLPVPEETGDTFRINATLKALAVARATHFPAVSDDSGLCVNALDGAPGVYSADWAGHPLNFKAAMNRVHDAMGMTKDRSAYFQAVLALVWPDGDAEYAEGYISGQIVWPPRGVEGFGYDPIFMPSGYAQTFGELGVAEKMKMSHRALALENLIKRCFA